MLRKLATGLVLSAAMLALFAPAAFAAVPDETVAITTTVEQDILWFDVSVSGVSHDEMVLKIFVPKKGGSGRLLWQRCSFPIQGDGTYRCGIDVGEGSAAEQRGGLWVARAFVGGDLVAKARYRL